MSVKQVFFRFMRVWIFAGALLVGQTFCSLSEESINEWDERVKQNSMLHLKVRFGLMALRNDLRFEPYICVTSMGETFSIFLGTVGYMLKQTNKFLETLTGSGFLSELEGLDKIYEKNGNLDLLNRLPEPSGPNVMKVTRVKVWAEYLKEPELGVWSEAVTRLSAAKDEGNAEMTVAVTRLIELLANLPYIDYYDRFAFLPLKEEFVLWEDVKTTHKDIKTHLQSYVEDAQVTHITHSPQDHLVFKHLLKFKDGRLNTTFIQKLNLLYRKNRFYRLAVSEEHVVFVKDYPGAYEFATRLQRLIRKLNTFARMLSGDKISKNLKIKYDSIDSCVQAFRHMDSIENFWMPYLVVLLKSTVERKQPQLFTNVGEDYKLVPEFLRYGGGLLELVKKQLQIYTTYEILSHSELTKGTAGFMEMPHDKAEKRGLDFRVSLAFMDKKSKDLKTLLLGYGVKQICLSLKNSDQSKSQELSFLKGRLTLLCSVRHDIENAGSDVTTFYSRFQEHFSPAMLANLEKMTGLDQRLPIPISPRDYQWTSDRVMEDKLTKWFAVKFASRRMLESLQSIYL